MTWDQVAAEAGVSTWTLLRHANESSRMRTTTKKGIERALQWSPGSIDKILAGGEPIPFHAPSGPDDRDRQIAELQQMATELTVYAERLKARIEELSNQQKRASG